MYYDARPSDWSGLFNFYDYTPFKTYYMYYMFKDVKALGGYVKSETKEDGVYTCAATNGKESAIILTYYNDDDNSPSRTVELALKNLPNERTRVEYYLTSEKCDAELVRSEILNSKEASLLVNLDLFDCLMIKFKAVAR